MRDVRGGGNPFEAGAAPGHRASPAFHFDDGDFWAVADPAFAADHVGQLAGGHAVHVGDFPLANERLEAGVENEPFDAFAAERVGAVEHEEGYAGFGASGHTEAHGVEIRVETRADVLYVEEHQVDTCEHHGIGFASLSVETVGGYAGMGVGDVGDGIVVFDANPSELAVGPY